MENKILKTDFSVRVLEPESGKFLTQSHLNEGEERTISRKVFLAVDAQESDWRIATEEEVSEYNKLHSLSDERI